jgi:hypothetical protein
MANWYFGENGQQIGPLDDHAIQQAIQQGRVTRQTLVWREGMAQWVPLDAVPELSGAPAALAPYAPPVYYGPGGATSMGPRTSGLAVASLICGISGIVICPFVGVLPALICGHMAMSQINQSPLPMSGRGMAIAGLVLGYLQILGVLVVMAVLVISRLSS